MVPKEQFYNIGFWLKDARNFLKSADFMGGLEDAEIQAMDNLFQSVERNLKAFLMTKGITVEMVHRLPGLLDQAVKYEPSWESLRKTLQIT